MRLKELIKTCFRDGRGKDRCLEMSETAWMVLIAAYLYCKKQQLLFCVTETVTTLAEDDLLQRTAETHRTGRSFDMSRQGWSQNQVDQFKIYLEKKYGELGAIDPKTGKPELVVTRPHGSGPHIHVQISRGFALPVKDFKQQGDLE